MIDEKWTVDEWIEEFSNLSPVETDGMDFAPAARVAVECGISPIALAAMIASVTPKATVAESGPVCLARRSMQIKPLTHILSIDRSVAEMAQ